jgi:hypothetical protein
MAEAFAVVSGSVSLASFALQLIDSAIKLRNLWSDVKGAPEEVSNLVHEIEIFGRVFGTIKAVHTPMPSNATFEEIFSQCCSLCEQGARDLESVAKDLETLIRKKERLELSRLFSKKTWSLNTDRDWNVHATGISYVSQVMTRRHKCE